MTIFVEEHYIIRGDCTKLLLMFRQRVVQA